MIGLFSALSLSVIVSPAWYRQLGKVVKVCFRCSHARYLEWGILQFSPAAPQPDLHYTIQDASSLLQPSKPKRSARTT